MFAWGKGGTDICIMSCFAKQVPVFPKKMPCIKKLCFMFLLHVQCLTEMRTLHVFQIVFAVSSMANLMPILWAVGRPRSSHVLLT